MDTLQVSLQPSYLLLEAKDSGQFSALAFLNLI